MKVEEEDVHTADQQGWKQIKFLCDLYTVYARFQRVKTIKVFVAVLWSTPYNVLYIAVLKLYFFCLIL